MSPAVGWVVPDVDGRASNSEIHPPRRKQISPRSSDLDHLDARIRKHGVESACVLPGPITDEEPEPRYLFAEVRDEVAGLLRGPRPVRVRGHAQDVQVAVTDLERD